MLVINLQNIEQLIFYDTKLRVLLPDLRHIIDQWLMSQRVPVLRSIKTSSLSDMITSLDQNHINILEKYFNDTVILDRIDYHIVKNVTLPLDADIEKDLVSCEEFNNFAIGRDVEQVYISFWR